MRLWLVLLPGLLLCVLWDEVGLHLGRAPLLYGGAAFNHLVPAVGAQLTPRILLGNALFLGGLRLPTLGSDGALWSLAFEFWYYLLFPLGLLAVHRGAGWGRRSLLLALLVLASWIAGPDVLLSFPIWLLGALLARVRLPVLTPGMRAVVVVVYVPLLFGMTKIRGVSGRSLDYLLAALTAGLMVAVLSARRRADETAYRVRWTRWLARGSFTLYVVHLPFAVLLTSLVAGDGRWQPSGMFLFLGLGVLALTLVYAYAWAWLTEFRTEAVRNWLEIRLGITAP